MAEAGYCSVIICLLVMLICGAVFLGNAYNYTKTYNGILVSGNVYTETSCTKKGGCNNKYYVNEIFKKGQNETNTCTIRRPTVYYFYGDAQNHVQKLVLHTERKIYQVKYDVGTCFDEKIKNYYETVGYILLCFPLFIVASVVFILFCVFLEKNIETKVFTPLWTTIHQGMVYLHNRILACFCKSSENNKTVNDGGEIV
jgi:hypothetical protein